MMNKVFLRVAMIVLVILLTTQLFGQNVQKVWKEYEDHTLLSTITNGYITIIIDGPGYRYTFEYDDVLIDEKLLSSWQIAVYKFDVCSSSEGVFVMIGSIPTTYIFKCLPDRLVLVKNIKVNPEQIEIKDKILYCALAITGLVKFDLNQDSKMEVVIDDPEIFALKWLGKSTILAGDDSWYHFFMLNLENGKVTKVK